MTYAELDALPEISNGFGIREEVRDGQVVRIPVLQGFNGVMYHAPDDPMLVIDRTGQWWRLGRVNGVLSKRLTLRPW